MARESPLIVREKERYEQKDEDKNINFFDCLVLCLTKCHSQDTF